MSNIKYVQKEEEGNNLLNYILIAFIVILGISIFSMLYEKTNIKHISYAEYEEKIKSTNYTVVLLTRDSCSHCQVYKPFVDAVAQKYEFTVYDLDVEEFTEDEFNYIHDNISALKTEFSSSGEVIIPTPTTIILKDGREVASKVGNIGEDGFLELLKNNGVVKK